MEILQKTLSACDVIKVKVTNKQKTERPFQLEIKRASINHLLGESEHIKITEFFKAMTIRI